MQPPELFCSESASSEDEELIFDTNGSSIDFAFEIEEDSDCEEDNYDEGKYEE
jgi:hypothetical protein